MSDDLPPQMVKGSEGSPTYLNPVPPGAENMVTGRPEASPEPPSNQAPQQNL